MQNKLSQNYNRDKYYQFFYAHKNNQQLISVDFVKE